MPSAPRDMPSSRIVAPLPADMLTELDARGIAPPASWDGHLEPPP